MFKNSLLLLILLSPLFSSDLKIRTQEFPASEMKAQNITIAEMSAKALSKDLPHKVDKYTTLQNITNEEATIIYTFYINSGSKSDQTIQREDKSRMKKAITTGVCQASKQLIKAKIEFTYIYISEKSQNQLFKFHISQKDCIGI